MPSSVTHFEIFAEEPASLAEFYRQLFGWTIEKAPGIDYFMIDTGAGGATALRGGLSVRPIPEPRSWVHYVSVDSIDDAVAQVVSLGGSVLRDKTAVPKTAWYAVAADPQGNIFALWQADPLAFPDLRPEP
jgi:uncharacterized protein